MSVTWNMHCVDCQRKVWIGQRGSGSTEPWLYGGKEKQLGEWLAKHAGHELRYSDEFFDHNSEYAEDSLDV